ncbi:site-specific DNA-methyltransferase [Desulfatiglans anilini]|uniref:site-specific DNA-methyltransferase n=1 Tax=Desulfatiglans anilini TaxID=90728 RepID=UPI0003FF1BE1|nr:site-specific DNA-methyltransferase [Desulfatiglans anilini]
MNKLDLTDNEKRDVIKYLELDRPLPEKYRFLLFDSVREVELVWNGKTDEIENLVLPFQVIEQIDEPRSEDKITDQTSLFDLSGRQIKGWSNKLIWGDNKLILSSLKNGPLRKEIEAEGGLKLIYIDPPFDVGADFSLDIEIGDESFTKKPSIIEEIAYRDTWGKGTDSFISMIYERLKLIHGLLANDGSIYVHCDWRLSSYIKLILDEIFSKHNFRGEVIWKKDAVGKGAKKKARHWPKTFDNVILYSKSDNYIFNSLSAELTNKQLNEFRYQDSDGRKFKRTTLGDYSNKSIQEMEKQNLIYVSATGKKYKKYYLDEYSLQLDSIWTDLPGFGVATSSAEIIGYPTQKPEKLVERIITASSNQGDLVADFFCGSGTTLAVAEKLGRKWIGSDLGRFSIHTTRKRLIGVQRELKKAGKDFRAFEILNIGKYEREQFLNINEDLRKEEKHRQKQAKEKQFINLILSAYKAEPIDSYNNFVGKKRDRLIAIGQIDRPVTNYFLEKILMECRENGITKADILGFDYEMGLDFEGAKKLGIDIQFKVIPREIFDKKAVEKGQVKFYDVAYIEVKPIVRGRKNAKEIAIELVDFSVFYNQDDAREVEEKLNAGGSKVVIENGQVIKISKDKKTNAIEKEVLTKKWTDWIDYWSVDFEFESKKEFIKVLDENTGEEKEQWTGSYIFENEWQSFRTKKNRSLELITAFKEVKNRKMKIAVKVIDIFGNDTTKIIEVNI